MKRFLFVLIAVIIFVSTISIPITVNADNSSFSPSDDSYVVDNTNANFGTATYMNLDSENNGFVNFDLSSIPAGSNIISANLKFYLTNTGRSSGIVSAYRATSSWNEETLDYYNQPSFDDSSKSSRDIGGLFFGNWYSWDVKSDVQEIVLGSENNGWCLKVDAVYPYWIYYTNSGGFRTYQAIYDFNLYMNTKESANDKPFLEVTYDLPDTDWEQMSFEYGSINSIWGTSTNNIYATNPSYGSGIAHFDGQWHVEEITLQFENPSGSIDYPFGYGQDIWGSSASDVYAVGGRDIVHFDGIAWSGVYHGLSEFLGIWGSSSNDVFAVGWNGLIVHFDGNSWNQMSVGVTNNLLCVWGSSSTDVYVGGDENTVFHYDGVSWSLISDPIFLSQLGRISDIWGSSPTDIYFANYNYNYEDGRILHYDGVSWTEAQTGFSIPFWDIYGRDANDVYAVADSGLILHYDGVSWTQSYTNRDSALYGVWGCTSISSGWGYYPHVFVVGDGSIILHNGLSYPVFDIGPDIIVNEGERYSEIAHIYSAESNYLTATIDYGDGSNLEYGSPYIGFLLSHVYADNGLYELKVKIRDNYYQMSSIITKTITVMNVVPTIVSLSKPDEPYYVGQEIQLTAQFTDQGIYDSHIAYWEWGYQTTEGVIEESNGVGTITGSYTYQNADEYLCYLTMKDNEYDLGVFEPFILKIRNDPAVFHGSFIIDGNNDFTVKNGVSSGTGTETDPYIITDWILNPGLNSAGIFVRNTDAYFEIRNCTISFTDTGLYFENATNGKVTNCTITQNNVGIKLDSSAVLIDKSEIAHNLYYGVGTTQGLDPSELDVRVHFCKIHDNGEYGVFAGSYTVLDAVNNWWGSSDGPSGYGLGSGDSVSEFVNFEPWLTAPISSIQSQTIINPDIGPGKIVISIDSYEIEVQISDIQSEVYAGFYESIPVANAFGIYNMDNFVDVFIPDTSSITEVLLSIGDADQNNDIYWLDTDQNEWVLCSDIFYDEISDSLFAKITDTSTPSLDQLTGSIFVVAPKIEPIRFESSTITETAYTPISMSVQVSDQFGFPLEGALVIFSSYPDGVSLPSSGVTDENGQLTIIAKGTNAGEYSIQATSNGETTQCALLITAPSVSIYSSSFEFSGVTNNLIPLTVQVTGSGFPLEGALVVFSSYPDGVSLPSSGVTDENGQLNIELLPKKSGNYTIYATVAGQTTQMHLLIIDDVPWYDSVDYLTMDEMLFSGWEIESLSEEATVGGGYLTLNNYGNVFPEYYSWDTYAYLELTEINPVSTNNYRVETKAMMLEAFTNDQIITYPLDDSIGPALGFETTSLHSYVWTVDYFDGSFLFFKDDVLVWSTGGFDVDLNEWFTLAVEKVGNTFYLFQDDQITGYFVEEETEITAINSIFLLSNKATVMYDYVNINFTTLPIHEPISITGNSQLYGVSSGSGTSSDPYIIENWIIPNLFRGINIMHTNSYFTIRNCTIQHAGYTPMNSSAGLFLYSASNVRILNSTILGNNNGYGIGLFSSKIKIENTIISDNDYGVYSSDSETILHFCNITDNQVGVYSSGPLVVDAVNNWWGSSDGPSGYGLGIGDSVSNYVNFDPWLTATVTTATSQEATDETIVFEDSGVSADVSGTAEVYIATYEDAPQQGLTNTIDKYIDVYIPDSSALNEITVKVSYTLPLPEGVIEGSLTLRWYDDNQGIWVDCSETGVNIVEKNVWARITATSIPTINDFDGTIFGITPLIPTITYDSSSNAIVEINEQATLNILITDQYGIPVKNTLVAFSIDTLGILLPETGTTDSNGYLTINAISENSGVYLISASLYGVTEQWTLVIYDPEGSYVTGGGWFNSPQGAYAPDSTLTGKATFGFVSKYKKGANIPIGETQFQFKYANLNFHSTSYDWMVVAGSKAQYKGTGTINGEGEYGFMLTATDGDLKDDKIDTFRLKIWDKTTDTLVYDNMLGSLDGADPTTAIGGGSIIIHK